MKSAILRPKLRAVTTENSTMYFDHVPYNLVTSARKVNRVNHTNTSWINWTNLMSLYESFFLLLNMFQMLLHSSSGAVDCMRVYCSVTIHVYVLASSLLVSVYLWVYWFVACYYNVPWVCSFVLCKGYHVLVSVCTGALVRLVVTSCWFNLFN